MATGGDKDYESIMAKEADRGVFGLPSEQCPICGNACPPIKALSKEAIFQNTYGAHYVCSRDANTPAYMEFEKEFVKSKSIADKKKAQTDAAVAGGIAQGNPPVQTGVPPQPAQTIPVVTQATIPVMQAPKRPDPETMPEVAAPVDPVVTTDQTTIQQPPAEPKTDDTGDQG